MSVARNKRGGGARVSAFARRLLGEWRRRGWPVRGERVVVAVSGGADSTALLLALDELLNAGLLESELTVAHLNHGLRGGEGAEDARWVAGLSRSLGYAVELGEASVGERAAAGRDNLEQAARRARYEFLSGAARKVQADAVLVAHTLDDQAETVLLRLLRGSGAEGLGGMRPERALEGGGEVQEVGGNVHEGGGLLSLRRPLLSWARRADTEGFCRERGVSVRPDAMNEDERFARVRVRRVLLPLLETFNPRAAEALARAADILREDSAALDTLAAGLLAEVRAETQTDEDGARPLRVEALASAPAALRRRALRQWVALGRGDLRRVELAHVLAVERLLAGTRGGRVVELPGGSRVERRRGLLLFRRGPSPS